MSSMFAAWWERYTRGWAPQSQQDRYRVAQAAYSEGWADGAAYARLGLEPSKRDAAPAAGAATSWGFPFDPPKGAAQGGGLPEAAPGLPPAPEAPEAPAVHALMEFRGNLLIATDAGLFELDPMANTAYRVPLYNGTTRSHEG